MRFICDVMLGKLAKRLRLLGFDTIYARSSGALEELKGKEGDRVLLTRRSTMEGCTGTVRVESERVAEQLREIRGLIGPAIDKGRVFGRCTECNAELIEVEKTEIESLVPEFVYHTHARFRVCPSCKRVYWEGSHTESMKWMLKELLP
jgi:uncharacterized protein with PIN domain